MSEFSRKLFRRGGPWSWYRDLLQRRRLPCLASSPCQPPPLVLPALLKPVRGARSPSVLRVGACALAARCQGSPPGLRGRTRRPSPLATCHLHRYGDPVSMTPGGHAVCRGNDTSENESRLHPGSGGGGGRRGSGPDSRVFLESLHAKCAVWGSREWPRKFVFSGNAKRVDAHNSNSSILGIWCGVTLSPLWGYGLSGPLY